MDRNIPANQQRSKAVILWLIVGLFMVYTQIIIGGITRLTGSGLSITKWEIVTGTLPPMTEEVWQEEFVKYQETPQYKKINVGMKMGSIFTAGTFKFIYFWEYLHRLWARSMGFVFLFPFLFFYLRQWIPKSLARRLGIVVLLAALAATFGWIMVASGLVNRPWVNAYKLSLHLCIGISVFIALWWAFIRYLHPNRIVKKINVNSYVLTMLTLLVIQIFLGGVMSGTKAALFVNTWPDLNGAIIPAEIFELRNWSMYNFNNYEETGFLVTLVQFLHRGLAYIITVYAIYILVKRSFASSKESIKSYYAFIVLLLIQVLVGIITLIKSIGMIPVYWGVIHQGIAVLLLSAYILHTYYSKWSIAFKESTQQHL